ncbi:MAG: hypothetical protein LQ346_003166 [Caloplaca aetnensis]|nr:MAG: hypothetical protein LQ346_003166 [Caloplaca aetnensis]
MSPSRDSPPLPNEVLVIPESQWLFTENELLRTPSILDGLSPDKERENRGKGVNFIFQVGIMLKLPQVTQATASVLLHRFYVRHSMIDAGGRPGFHYYTMAATSVFLATKIEENCRKMKELVIACVRVAQKDPHKMVDEQDKEYWRWKDNILHNEDVLLEALCFDLTLEPPYKTLSEYLNHFGEGDNRRLRNSAWAFINDSCMTVLCLMFSSKQIAASALYAAAKHCGTNIQDDEEGRSWWEVLNVDLNSIKKICNHIATIYENVQVKNGRDVSIHERTPEDGDDSTGKTRAPACRAPESPVTDRLEGDEESRKRIWSVSEEYDRAARNGQTLDRPDELAKNSKAKARPMTNGHVATNGDEEQLPAHDVSGQIGAGTVDDISEEGEVES